MIVSAFWVSGTSFGSISAFRCSSSTTRLFKSS
jgi:hypothetical protein